MPPTIVLVHGAFAESASWDRVIRHLEDAGHAALAAPNPLRGLASDAAAVSDLVRTLDGPLGDALRPVPRSDGTTDLYIVPERFHEQFCAGVPAPEAARMAVTQRPV